VFTTALGTVDELYQGLLVGRSFIWYDILLNGLGGVLGLMIIWGMSRK
jgi:glycopeptide antibiotics resistance protein